MTKFVRAGACRTIHLAKDSAKTPAPNPFSTSACQLCLSVGASCRLKEHMWPDLEVDTHSWCFLTLITHTHLALKYLCVFSAQGSIFRFKVKNAAPPQL